MKFNIVAVVIPCLLLLMVLPVLHVQGQSMVMISNVEIVTVEEDITIVTWTTNIASDTSVAYGEGTDLDREATVEGDTRYHYCVVEGLDPDKEYSIQVSSGGSMGPVQSFTTLSSKPSSATRIALLADTHLDMDGNNMPNGAMYGDSPDLLASFIDEYLDRGDIDAVILMGDNVQGDEEDWAAMYDTYLGSSRIVHYPVMGNWDKSSPNWETYFSTHIGLSSSYYSMDIGAIHLIILDSAVSGQVGGSIGSEQLEWLSNDLDDNTDSNILILMHHLYYVDSNMGIDQESYDGLKAIVDDNPNVLSIISGHDHKNTFEEPGNGPRTTTVASLVQYPVGYTVLELWEEGYSKSFYKVGSSLETSENSRMRIVASSADTEEDEDFLGTIYERNHIVRERTNTRPLIDKFIAGKYLLEPGEETTLTVDAEDPDGDRLEYSYAVESGEIIGSGPEVIYRAPDLEGRFEIEVTVSDGELGSLPLKVLITVQEEGTEPGPDPEPRTNSAPKIEKVMAGPLKVPPNGEVSISVYATDPEDDPLQYEYSFAYGEIIGYGNEVVWKAPSTRGPHVVSVTVFDGSLRSEVEEIHIDVEDEEVQAEDSPSLGILMVMSIPIIAITAPYLKKNRMR